MSIILQLTFASRCRAISYFNESPIRGVTFIRYYCFASHTGNETKAPQYETILRALCARLAWKRDGSVDKHAADRHTEFKKNPDTSPNDTTWEVLLTELIAASKTPIVFVIDALDECQTLQDCNKLLDFMYRLRSKGMASGPYCMFSSLPHIKVEDYFENSIQILDAVQPIANKDMERFIDDQIALKKNNARWKKCIFCKP